MLNGAVGACTLSGVTDEEEDGSAAGAVVGVGVYEGGASIRGVVSLAASVILSWAISCSDFNVFFFFFLLFRI